MLKYWTILSSGSEGLMHAAMGNAHWVKMHDYFPEYPDFQFRRFDGSSDKSETLLGFLDTVNDDGIHLGIFDDIYMRRITRFRVLDGVALKNIVGRLQSRSALPFIMVLQTVPINPSNFDMQLTHEVGHTLKINKVPLNKEMCESLGGVCVNAHGAKELSDYLKMKTDHAPNVYYFPEPVVTQYQWEYNI